MRNFSSGKICLTLVTIPKIQSFLIRLIKVIEKMKDKFVGLRSKMYSIKKVGGKEYNTVKGVSIATEFKKFKDILFNKIIIRHKMKRIQNQKHKLGTYEIDNISFSFFDEKRYLLDDGIHTLAYFHKDSVTSYENIKKDCDKKDCKEIKKDCDKKDCDN